MYIANPIYDVVFKFMMEDNRVARAFISAIIQEEVTELEFAAKEQTVRLNRDGEKQPDPEMPQYTVCRFDFTARISLAGGGHKTVLIELQKAKYATDIMRFRRYLGRHYQDTENTYGEKEYPKARQIYCIFLLGYDVDVPGCPVFRVDACAKDVTTNEEVEVSSEFIESLHHRSWIVQIRELKQRRRNDLEKLLSIFDQANRTRSHYILNVNEEDFPEACQPIINRLIRATVSADIQMEMENEDDYYTEIQTRERRISEQIAALEETKKALGETQKALEEKDKVLEEKDKVIEEQRKALEEQKKAFEEQRKAFEETKKGS
jgi:tetratricopeptide (TPR) repeat protein